MRELTERERESCGSQKPQAMMSFGLQWDARDRLAKEKLGISTFIEQDVFIPFRSRTAS